MENETKNEIKQQRQSLDQEQILDSRKKSVAKCIELLKHACNCHGDDCQLEGCARMQRSVLHVKICKLREKCLVYKQILALCFYHAQNCLDNISCQMPACSVMKQHIERIRKS